ncbi:uncharacterized protein LOC116853082 [Odontomachus brunneus]|uniref:uncharacterized protein LOC116853082 n=1 Tax=Odontomachus brunneus TaxID=486640 RepID=UPI0013F2752B|nr:uncharacterized protein LOC116853082 [Odontomachus brunneus]
MTTQLSVQTKGRDWKRRLWLFDRLVWTVMKYGAEIWGWREREELERVQERFVKWTIGVKRRTPGYMIKVEVGREKMRGRTGKRAWNFERKLEKGGEEMVAHIYSYKRSLLFQENLIECSKKLSEKIIFYEY